MTLRRLSLFLVPTGASLGVAGLVIWSDSSQRQFLLLFLGVVIPLPIIVRVFRRQFDPFEPIVLISFAFFLLFFLRPAAHLAYGEMEYAGMRIDRGFDQALIVAATGVIALYIGYAAGVGRRAAQRLRPLPSRLNPEGTIMAAGGLLVVGFVLYALYIEQVGGLTFARKVLRGRDPSENLVLGEATAYFRFGAFLTIPATLLLLEAAAAKRRALFVVLTAVGTALFLVMITGPRGDRIWLLLLVMGIFLLPYLRSQKRPRARTLALIGVVWFGFGVTFLEDVRVPVAREASPVELFKRSAKNPFHGWRDFILGADTEMFSVMALETELVPSIKPHEPGLTVVSLATTWIPRRLYSGKPETTDFEVYSMIFPERARVSRAGSSPSILGGFYYDSGLIGVAIGALLFGLLSRVLYEYLVAYPTSAGVRLLYASTLPFVAITVRGNPTDTVGRMAYIVFPIILALWWAGRREPQRAHLPSVVRVGQ